jgi:hypothetical protein
MGIEATYAAMSMAFLHLSSYADALLRLHGVQGPLSENQKGVLLDVTQGIYSSVAFLLFSLLIFIVSLLTHRGLSGQEAHGWSAWLKVIASNITGVAAIIIFARLIREGVR